FVQSPRRPRTSTLFPYTTLFRSSRTSDPPRLRARAPLGRVRGPAQTDRDQRRRRPVGGGGRSDQEAVDHVRAAPARRRGGARRRDRKSTRLNSSHSQISYAVFCL